MKSKCMDRSRGARTAAGVFLAAAALAGMAGAAPAQAPSLAVEAPAQGLVARAELDSTRPGRVVVGLTGGAPFGVAELCLEGAQGRVLQAVLLDGMGSYRRELRARVARSALRLSFRAQVAQSALVTPWQVSNAVYVPGLPGASGAAVTGGRAVVSEIMKNPVAVPDSVGEWIEIYNGGDATLDLEGWSLSDTGSNFHVISVGGAGLLVQPGGRLVLGNNDDPLVNGGVNVDYRYSSFTLSNGADAVLLNTPGGVLADGVLYDGTSLWPNTPGVSMSLSGNVLDAIGNDNPAAWCDALTPFSTGGDLGTPGQRNPICP